MKSPLFLPRFESSLGSRAGVAFFKQLCPLHMALLVGVMLWLFLILFEHVFLSRFDWELDMKRMFLKILKNKYFSESNLNLIEIHILIVQSWSNSGRTITIAKILYMNVCFLLILPPAQPPIV